MLLRLWTGLLQGAAMLAGAILAGMFLAIVVDVGIRTAGLQPPLWTGAFTELGLIYTAMLAAPWLVSRGGHIRVTALTDRLPARLSRRIERGIFAVLALLCLLLAWTALDIALDTWRRGEVDYRSVPLPRWVLFAALPPAFLMMGVEFARLALTGHADRTGSADAERSL